MTLDEALRIASDVWHYKCYPNGAPTPGHQALMVLHEHADRIRRAHKLTAVEAELASVRAENEALNKENEALNKENEVTRGTGLAAVERLKLNGELAEKNQVIADLMVELARLKKGTNVAVRAPAEATPAEPGDGFNGAAIACLHCDGWGCTRCKPGGVQRSY